MPSILGQGSGDFREMGGRVHPLHVGYRSTTGIASPDAFTQANPPVVAVNVSTTLTGVPVGVLGSSVVFTRPDVGNGVVGGPVAPGAVYNAGITPLGIVINDAIGNPFENSPGVASNRIPYYAGQGCLGVTLWETQNLTTGADLTYAPGDKLYASANGLLTNLINDAYQFRVAGQNDPDFVTLMGIVRVAPDANNSFMVLDLRV